MEEKESLLLLAEEAARRTGGLLKSARREVMSDLPKDLKITADRDAHDFLRSFLEGRSSIRILSEEDEGHDFSLDRKWVVDPLDGSINFFRGIPLSAISIGLMEDGEPILGVTYDFNRGDLYSGIVEGGATCNGKRIHVSNISSQERVIMMTGFPAHTDYSAEALEKYISMVRSYKKVRLIGSAALSLAYVASGNADAYYEKDIRIWDVAAGLALVRAAGGDYRMSPTDKKGKINVFASNGKIVLSFSYNDDSEGKN